MKDRCFQVLLCQHPFVFFVIFFFCFCVTRLTWLFATTFTDTFVCMLVTYNLASYPGRSVQEKNGLVTYLSSNCWLSLPLSWQNQSDFRMLHVTVVEFQLCHNYKKQLALGLMVLFELLLLTCVQLLQYLWTKQVLCKQGPVRE